MRRAMILALVAGVAAMPARADVRAKNAVRAEDVVFRVTACLFERDQPKVATLLISWPGSVLEFRTMDAMNRRLQMCMPPDSGVYFPRTMLRGIVAQQALLQQFAAWTPLPPLAVDWAREPLANPVAPMGALHAFARCVVQAAPEQAHALARSARGSAEEGAAVDTMRPAIAGCVPPGRQFAIDRAGLRGLTAEALLAAMNRGEGAPSPATLHAEHWPPRD